MLCEACRLEGGLVEDVFLKAGAPEAAVVRVVVEVVRLQAALFEAAQ